MRHAARVIWPVFGAGATVSIDLGPAHSGSNDVPWFAPFFRDSPPADPLPVAKPEDLPPDPVTRPTELRGPDEPLAAPLPVAKPDAARPTVPDAPEGTPAAVAECGAARVSAMTLHRIGRQVAKYYVYSGDRSDPDMRVIAEVQLSPEGKIEGKPQIIQARGGTDQARQALGDAGRRALIRAAHGGAFEALPIDEYVCWRRLRVVFAPESLRF